MHFSHITLFSFLPLLATAVPASASTGTPEIKFFCGDIPVVSGTASQPSSTISTAASSTGTGTGTYGTYQPYQPYQARNARSYARNPKREVGAHNRRAVTKGDPLPLNIAANKAVADLKTFDLWKSPNISSRMTNYRRVDPYTAYAFNDSPCPQQFTSWELDVFIQTLQNNCFDDHGNQIIGYAYQEGKYPGSKKEYGILSTAAFHKRTDFELQKKWQDQTYYC